MQFPAQSFERVLSRCNLHTFFCRLNVNAASVTCCEVCDMQLAQEMAAGAEALHLF